jgi:hypothetical protein
MKRLETGGIKRADLSKTYSLNGISKPYDVQVWETFSSIKVNGNNRDVWAHPVKGTQINVYIYSTSDIFLKFKRDKTDLALMEVSQLIKALGNLSTSISEIYFELLKQLPDEEYSEKILRNRIDELQIRILKQLALIFVKNPKVFMDALSAEVIAAAEGNAASLFPKVKWSDVKKSGMFASCLPLIGLKELVEKIPSELFDNKLFTQHFATFHAPKARDRTQGYTAKVIADLSEIQSSHNRLNSYELSLTEISLDFLEEVLVNDQHI